MRIVINKWIRRHILWEYWVVLVLMVLSVLISGFIIVNPIGIFNGFKSQFVQIHVNTIVLVLLFFWLRFLKKRLKE